MDSDCSRFTTAASFRAITSALALVREMINEARSTFLNAQAGQKRSACSSLGLKRPRKTAAVKFY